MIVIDNLGNMDCQLSNADVYDTSHLELGYLSLEE